MGMAIEFSIHHHQKHSVGPLLPPRGLVLDDPAMAWRVLSVVCEQVGGTQKPMPRVSCVFLFRDLREQCRVNIIPCERKGNHGHRSVACNNK